MYESRKWVENGKELSRPKEGHLTEKREIKSETENEPSPGWDLHLPHPRPRAAAQYRCHFGSHHRSAPGGKGVAPIPGELGRGGKAGWARTGQIRLMMPGHWGQVAAPVVSSFLTPICKELKLKISPESLDECSTLL